MPEEKVYQPLIKITPWFTEGLSKKYPGCKTFLSFEKAAEKCNNRFKDIRWNYKINETHIKTYIKYLIDEGFPIAVLSKGIYWITSIEDINYARGQWSGIVKSIAVKLDTLNKQAEQFEDKKILEETLFSTK